MGNQGRNNPHFVAFKEKCNLSKKLKPMTDGAGRLFAPLDKAFDSINEWGVNNALINKLFNLKNRNSTLTQEFRAGTVTFLTLAYIISVNANIIGATGGPCGVEDCVNPNPGCIFDDPFTGMPDPGYQECLDSFKKGLTSSTILGSMIMCFLMGILGNMPIALAPGMGLNAYFAFTAVGYRGTGSITYEEAVTAIFIEGFIFMLLGITGVRGKLIRYVPKSVMLATSAGIGVFLAFIGLQYAEGIGVVTYDSATLVRIGGCPPENRRVQFTPTPDICTYADGIGSDDAFAQCRFNLGPPSNTFQCSGGEMQSATLWLGIASGAIMATMMKLNMKGAILVGVLFGAIVAWIPGHAASYVGEGSSFPGGEARLEYLKKIVDVPSFEKVLFQFDFGGLKNGDVWLALITFLYVDFLDTTGTLYSMAQFIGMYVPGYLNPETRSFDRQLMCFTVDGFGTSLSGCLGMSPITAYIESGSGIREGGRTGLTAIATSFYFFIALWFTPIFSTIAPYATGPALILVGAMMFSNIVTIDWRNPQKGIPAFLTIILMPLTYSISYGIIAGVVAYILLGVLTLPAYLFFPDWFKDSKSLEDNDELHHDGAVQFEGPRGFSNCDPTFDHKAVNAAAEDDLDPSVHAPGAAKIDGKPAGAKALDDPTPV